MGGEKNLISGAKKRQNIGREGGQGRAWILSSFKGHKTGPMRVDKSRNERGPSLLKGGFPLRV